MTVHALSSILYVEDDPDIRTVAQMALEVVGGFSVTACASGAEALAAVDGELVPDLFLLDVMMPGLDGPATLSALRRMPSVAQVPAIFMTAKVQESEIALYKWLGAIGVVAKPFDPMHLPQQLRQLWETGGK
ncbi:MAG TPA: response regulator [Noviherbaspirillum sp.]|jgi:CheY-like chemotaxis protein|uniref:response regulator n=1 Tax=Noviherbaspirillum sp. TaxID=1926288 RepID=UPI002DDD5FEF|nr:response regulator [Noviherbaspirillum sp.]HEV2610352.1 response regulator [Noviherbaspirillum sp.]